MSKVIAKISLNWKINDPDCTSLNTSFLPKAWHKSYYITGMPAGYFYNSHKWRTKHDINRNRCR